MNKEESAATFLGSVARAYTDTHDDLSQVCFVFPNKRAGTFFLRRMRETLGDRPVVAPCVMAITDFVEKLSGRLVDSRIDMLFRLYNIYRRLRGDNDDHGKEGAHRRFADFDAFRGWGETVLSDFSEVDRYEVDPDALFKNVSDYRAISSNFLTDNQIRILERYFGYKASESVSEVRRFWKELVPRSEHKPKEKTEVKARFLQLWQILGPLYHAFTDELESEGLCSPGGAYRLALAALERDGRGAIPWRKIVMVGFNALSTAEARIFETLREFEADPQMPGDFAEFFWDGTGPVLADVKNDAAAFLKLNRRNFPQPEWAEPYLRLNRRRRMPEVLRAVGAPSNSAQAKIAGAMIEEFLQRDGGREAILDARVAVVLPDESLLMPLAYALPQLDKVNITMGYPLRLTSVVSFVSHLRRLYAGMGGAKGEEPTYYHEHLRLFLSHPFTHALLGSGTVSRINAMLTRSHALRVPVGAIRAVSEEAAMLLTPPAPSLGSVGIADYIDDLLLRVSDSLRNADGTYVKQTVDRAHIETYRDALRRLKLAAARHGISMSPEGVFGMVDKLIAGETVTFDGMPLRGLQVMGLLETRALDFDHVIILSMNDRDMPMRARKRTFIPDSLRHGYGMPYASYQEELFSYYFYRMISRARGAAFLYDARSGEGMRSGGVSRYLLQLRNLYARGTLREESYRFLLSEHTRSPHIIDKTPAVLARLGEYLDPESKRHLSASALKKYASCPVRFYYEVVMGLKADTPQDSVYIDAATMGQVIHRVLLEAYFPQNARRIYLDRPIVLTADVIRRTAADDRLLDFLVRRAINIEHFHADPGDAGATGRPLDGATQLQAEHIKTRIRQIMEYDAGLAPFSLLGGEISGRVRWNFNLDNREAGVYLKYAIDRLDTAGAGEDAGTVRVVDYKTGKPKVTASSLGDLFTGVFDSENLLQLMVYASLLERDPANPRCGDSGAGETRMVIYEPETIAAKGETVPKIGNKPVPGYRSLREEYIPEFDSLLCRIFDSTTPFTPTEDTSACAYCNLKALCGR